MQEKELEYYSECANWDFSTIKVTTEKLSNFSYFDEIAKHTNEESVCLDLGTAGGEKLLENYPHVNHVYGIDFSKEMIETANNNLKKYPEKNNVEFLVMDNLNITFSNETFDLVSARHTVIDTKKIYDILKPGGVLVIEGVDKYDAWDIKEIFKCGQGCTDTQKISDVDYENIVSAGFSSVQKCEILENEYYETKEDLLALLLRVPILDDFSEIDENNFEHLKTINKELFDEYVKKFTTPKGILLKRVLYGIVARK